MIRQYGNKTECALLGFLYKLQYDYAKLRQEFPVNQIHRVFAFNSMRKLMRTIIKLPDDQGFRLLAKVCFLFFWEEKKRFHYNYFHYCF